ncbi:hypothetical protein I203_101663 [Kwoniella mangroviensis CBS 8507]|uniref:uncharacterized protein n=1 Tax=Kwoniella mangroviensis CBS 8507 TaxID=1296122 RepID=UPI00080D3D94|nr:uncharacterized protein I203_07229 [Kwoniella mangroviensis CBS 8507]OCF63533.1 hypothetical protein I203_07229 [Kwoniella mangroviensis CBS 8507]
MAVYLSDWIRRYLSVRSQVRGLPTISSLFEFFESSYRQKLPHISFIVPVRDYTIDTPWDKYAKFRSDLFACPQLSTPSYAVYVTSNSNAAVLISNKSGLFGKPIDMFRYVAINIFGKQITSTQSGDEHYRHKKIVKPCFNENIMQTGWSKMVEAFQTMKFEETIEGGGTIEDVKDCMIKLTLYVFGRSGFNMDFPWNIPQSKAEESMPFAEALHTVESSITVQVLVPFWTLVYFPLKSVRRLGQAQKSFVSHLKAMYHSKRLELKSSSGYDQDRNISPPPKDILGALVASQMSAESEERLKASKTREKVLGLMESEVIGNICEAGHETTGHTLTFLQAYLCVYPEWQDKLYEEIISVCGDEPPSYRHMSQLNICLAACYETIRLKDIVMTLPKIAMKDTTLPYTTWGDEGHISHKVHCIKKGSHIIIDSPALSLNPFVWTDPGRFDPTRFLDANGRVSSSINSFAGFSLGQRQCIGKRFAEVEMVAYISHLIKEYRLFPIEKDGETIHEMKARILKGTEELTLTPGKFAVRFEKR